ncbi:polysaccharide deacetylase family protein [Evansella tamaricis]|uniref:Polysaccharide deacetylase family protein n=1 Tax=Evansella tamaricis TaxID=2069301 RepID=A0ABS6JFZ7_9BACI|nr:polysaccharide deacetylase family protein [Evansella tamaricis]MBU9712134.1 polysaccharide deacetylase family protein [Evansella tamaricis]
MNKKPAFTTICSLFFLVMILSNTATANESMLMEAPIIIDGQTFRTPYIMRDGHLLVPAIFVKNTGAYVDKNEAFHSIVFSRGETKFAIPIGKNYSDDFDRLTGNWIRKPLATSSIEFQGVPFIPLIDVVKKLGMNVQYDANLGRTFITTNFHIKSNVVRKANTKEKLVALTFDDGPEDYYTPQIIDVLKQKNAPATFFVVGRQVQLFPEVMKQIVKEGHGIGNHTWNHPDLRKEWSGKVKEEIRMTQDEMEGVVGRRPHLFRPPFGAITKSDMRLLNDLGMKNMHWSVDTLDWSGLSADEILEIVHRDVSPGGIILQHNFQSNVRMLDGTVEALPRIIDELRAKGYTFVTLQTLLDMEQEE